MPVAAAAIPANKGLNIAGSVIGVAQMAAMVATAAIDAGLCFSKKIPSSMAKMLMNRNDIVLEDVNFQMFKTKTPAGELSCVARIDLKQLLKEKMNYSDITINFDVSTDPYLFLWSFSDLINLWSTLRSQNNDLIACDTACLLASIYIKDYIFPLSFLQNFLDAKYAFMQSIANAYMYPMNCMVKALPDKYVNCYKYLYHFNTLLDLVPGKYSSYTRSDPAISLKDILKPSEAGIIFVPGHAQVVMRGGASWKTYTFKDNDVTKIVNATVDTIETSLFSHIDSPCDRRILACKILD